MCAENLSVRFRFPPWLNQLDYQSFSERSPFLFRLRMVPMIAISRSLKGISVSHDSYLQRRLHL